jgi:hypothetical protein
MRGTGIDLGVEIYATKLANEASARTSVLIIFTFRLGVHTSIPAPGSAQPPIL